MSLYPLLARKLVLPLGDRVMGTSIARDLALLEKSQWWSREKLLEYQGRQLRQLLEHANAHVPYYKEQFRKQGIGPGDIRTAAELVKLPLLSKEIIMENFEAMASEAPGGRRWVTASSGGTTGVTLRYHFDNGSRSFGKAANIRGWAWAGYRLGDRYAELWSNPAAAEKNESLFRRLVNLSRKKLLLNMYDVTEETLKDYVSAIRRYKPRFIRGYANAVHTLARVVDPGELRPEWVITTAETLLPEMRTNIEEKFQCRVFDEYGGEGGAKANECHSHEGYHIPVEGLVMELLKDGEPVAPGETGELVTTDLHNYVMPFIRYRIGDLASASEEPCSCGRGLPLLKTIEGRVSDVLVTPGGKIITRPSFFGSSNIKKIQGLKEYQIVQEALDQVVMKAVVDSSFDAESETTMLHMARDILGDDVNISIEKVASIPVAPSGKRKVVVSKLGVSFN